MFRLGSTLMKVLQFYRTKKFIIKTTLKCIEGHGNGRYNEIELSCRPKVLLPHGTLRSWVGGS